MDLDHSDRDRSGLYAGPWLTKNSISDILYLFNNTKEQAMRTFIAFVAGVSVGAAGITFTDVARVADKGVEAAKSAVQETVKQ